LNVDPLLTLRGWKLRRLIAIFLLLSLIESSAYAQISGIFDGSVLTGKTGSAGEAELSKIVINPAHTGNLPASEIGFNWGLSSEEYNQRYPGFDAHSSSSFGMMGPPLPSGVWKPTNDFGLSAIILPFPIGQDIAKSGIPIIILNQENTVDFVGSGQVNFLAFGVAGYRFSEYFSLGAQFSYIDAGGDFKLLIPGVTDPLATVSANLTTLNSRVGMLLSFGPIVNIGLSLGAFSSSSSQIDFQSSLTGLGGGEAGPAPGGGESSSSAALNPLRIGVGISPTSRFEISLDIEYDRASSKEEFSIVDLKSKPKDLYDTVSVYAGTIVKLKSNWSVLAGYLYEPSAVGPGSPGIDGRSGFGFTDILLGMGELPSRPQWNIGLGFRKGFGKKQRNAKYLTSFQRLKFEFGFSYGETSIGINQGGEQPGAYLSRRTRFPIGISYKF
jgi:hypothetical protein